MVGDAWSSNKVVPTGTGGPLVKSDSNFDYSNAILSLISLGSQSQGVATASQDTGPYWSQNYSVFVQLIVIKSCINQKL